MPASIPYNVIDWQELHTSLQYAWDKELCHNKVDSNNKGYGCGFYGKKKNWLIKIIPT